MNKALRILLITNGVVMLAAAMLGPIYAIFVENIGGGVLEASWAVALNTLITAIFLFIFGRMEDKMKDPELAMAWGYLIIGFGFIGYLLCDSVIKLMLVQVVLGIGNALYTPAFDGLYSLHLDRGRAAAEWSNWEIMSNLITSVGALTGGFLANFFGFGIIFLAMGIFCFISSMLLFLQPKKVL